MKYFAGEIFTYAAQVDPSFSAMLKMASWVAPSTEDLEKDVVDFLTNMLMNHSVPSIELDSTNFEQIYEQKRLQFSNMSTSNNTGVGPSEPVYTVRSEASLTAGISTHASPVARIETKLHYYKKNLAIIEELEEKLNLNASDPSLLPGSLKGFEVSRF